MSSKRFDALLAMIAPVSDAPVASSIFIYGQPGSGKTRFVGSVSEHLKTLIIKAEEGTLSISDSGADAIPIHDATSLKNLRAKIDAILDFLESPEGKEAYEAVAIDSFSALTATAIRFFTEGGKKMQIQDWGELSGWIERINHRFTSLSQLSIGICHSVDIDNSDSKRGETRFTIRPDLPGKLRETITRYYDVSAYAYTVPDKDPDAFPVQMASIGNPGDKLTVKDRAGRLPNRLRLNYGEWLKAINGGES